MKILAIESSCDETSIAIVEDKKNVLSNIISSQIDIHKEFGGVVPEIASRHHLQNISSVYNLALKKANCNINDIDYIAVTNSPGLVGSLLVGLMFAKGLSYSNNIPLIPINHIHGHIFSTFIEHDVKLPMLTLVASGGHSSFYYIDENLNLTLLGQTIDDAIGESYDKIARILNLPYPGGPEIEKIAKFGKRSLKITKPKVDKFNFSLSGIKTFIINYVNQEKMKKNKIIPEDIAKSFQDTIIEIIIEKLIYAKNNLDIKSISIVGGVAANKTLENSIRNHIELNDIQIYFPSKDYCSDNAAMIASAAFYELNKESNLLVDAIDTRKNKRNGVNKNG